MVASDDYEKFLELQKTLLVERFEKEQYVIHQGDMPDNAYVIVSGSCKVKVSYTYKNMVKNTEKT